jgi:hypothetical protein
MSSTGNAYETIAKPETPVTLVVSFLTGTRAKAFASLAGGLLLWEIVGRLTSPVIFVPFSVVALAFWNLTVSGELIHHTAVSFTELILGFVIGSMIGIVGGTLAAFSKNFRVATDVWISIAYSTPYVAFVPLFIVWFGIDMASKIALVIYVRKDRLSQFLMVLARMTDASLFLPLCDQATTQATLGTASSSSS